MSPLIFAGDDERVLASPEDANQPDFDMRRKTFVALYKTSECPVIQRDLAPATAIWNGPAKTMALISSVKKFLLPVGSREVL